MTISVQDAIKSRVSIHRFQPQRPLDDQTIAELINMAIKAPSAFNMQNWRFIAVRSASAKQRLQQAAFGQQKITDSSVAFIVCGLLAAHHNLSERLQPSVEHHMISQATADAWVQQATLSHETNLALQRDEAIRSASLAAMTLMLGAQGMGLGSCPMVGFDVSQVTKDFGLAANELPVMIVVVGYPENSGETQKKRTSGKEILSVV